MSRTLEKRAMIIEIGIYKVFSTTLYNKPSTHVSQVPLVFLDTWTSTHSVPWSMTTCDVALIATVHIKTLLDRRVLAVGLISVTRCHLQPIIPCLLDVGFYICEMSDQGLPRALQIKYICFLQLSNYSSSAINKYWLNDLPGPAKRRGAFHVSLEHDLSKIF